MKTQTTFALVLGVLAVATLAGCRTGPAQQPDAPTENVSATVDAAIEATRTAEQSQAATVAAAVSATQTSTAAQAPATPTPPPEEPPTPTPSSEEYVTMTEEELAALVDEAVNEAVLATQDATAATETSTADGTVTQEEIETIEVVLADAEEAIALAEELIYIYADLYAELATEALIVLQEVEMLLEETTELVEATTAVVDEMAQLLDQGLELSEEMIDQLIALAEAAGVNATAIQTKAEGWLVGLQAELEQRATTVLAVLPTEIATDRRTAIASAYTYIETVQSALVDNKLSQLELSAIAQAGANASASLLAQGGPQLQNLADSLNDITARLAQGQLPDVQGLLESLEASLPPRPSLP